MFRSHGQGILRGALLVALAAVVVLAGAGSASAVSGSPVKLAQPQSYAPPSVAVGAEGTAYVAWDNTKGLGGIQEVVEYCVIPAGAKGCAHTGQLPLGSGPGYIFGHVEVLIDGSTVVIFAGDLAVKGEDYEPTQEWQLNRRWRDLDPVACRKVRRRTGIRRTGRSCAGQRRSWLRGGEPHRRRPAPRRPGGVRGVPAEPDAGMLEALLPGGRGKHSAADPAGQGRGKKRAARGCLRFDHERSRCRHPGRLQRLLFAD